MRPFRTWDPYTRKYRSFATLKAASTFARTVVATRNVPAIVREGKTLHVVSK